jgi:hypothetical protein
MRNNNEPTAKESAREQGYLRQQRQDFEHASVQLLFVSSLRSEHLMKR